MKIGYEFEFVTQKDSLDIEEDMKNIFGSEGEKFIVKRDMSIRRNKKQLRRDGWREWELVTHPQKRTTAYNTLVGIQSYLLETGAVTNYSTGFHVNISADRMSKFDPMTLISTVDESKFAKTFDRTDNPYCVPWVAYFASVARRIKRDKKVSKKYDMFVKQCQAIVDAVAVGDAECGYPHADRMMKTMVEKYMTINISKLQNKYVEFRMIGGNDYHQKELLSLVDSMATSVQHASKGKDKEFVQEYLDQYKVSL